MKTVQVAVVGGGPAGLSAAAAAAQSGASTVLLDEQAVPGGRLRYRTVAIPLGAGLRPQLVRPWVIQRDLIAQVRRTGVDLRRGAIAWGLFAENILAVVEPVAGASYQLRAERVILATGSTDLPFPFAGGSLPGVFSARALQILIHVHRLLPGRRVVVIGTGSEANEVVNDVRLAGGQVILQLAPAEAAALVAEGDGGVEAVRLGDQRLAAEIVAVAVGRQPDTQLALMTECAAGHSETLGGFVPVRDERLMTSREGIFIAGDAAGCCEVPIALAEGTLAGLSAAASLGLAAPESVAAAATALERVAPGRLAAGAAITATYQQG